MPRKSLIRTAEFPYHVVSRSNNKEWFYIPRQECWNVFTQQLSKVSKDYHARVISFVLMSNHFHMLLYTPEENLDAIMNYLLREVSRTIGRKSGRINHIFGAPYRWCLIDNEVYLAHAYKYVYRNPVEAGLSDLAEEYRYSTLHYLIAKTFLGLAVYDHAVQSSPIVPPSLSDRLHWLNRPYASKHQELIRRALKKPRFRLPQSKNYRLVTRTLDAT